MKRVLMVVMMGALAAEAAEVKVRFSPTPQSVTMLSEARVNVNAAPIDIRCPDEAAVGWVRKMLKVWLKDLAIPEVKAAAPGEKQVHGPEAYQLKVAAGRVEITADTLQGVRYAMYTYRQAWEAGRGTARLTHYTAPELKVDDWPSLKFRGIHFCWFRTDEGVTVKFMEHQLRMAAYCKFNYAVVEQWGGLRSERHPELCFSEKGTAPMSELRRLAELARDLGITVIPMMNMIGHASLAGQGYGKHAALDARPELQPLFEPDNGWDWCLTNEHTVKLQQELIAELAEACGNPPYFHIGGDESRWPSCSTCCAAPYAKTLAAHLTALNDFLKSRKMRMMMWHDGLLPGGDPRFKGFWCNGAACAGEILEALPRDVVICDWYYGGCWGAAERPEAYTTMDHFRKLGFEVVTCPWYNRNAAAGQSAYACKQGIKGLLMTTWARNYGEKYSLNWSHGPSDAWGTAEGKAAPAPCDFDVFTHWRQCGWDMGLKPADEEEFGFVSSQFSRVPEHID